MKKIKFALLSAILFFASATPASAAYFTAKISGLLFYEQGDLIYIYVVGGTQGRPACAGSNGDYISFSMKRPRANQYLAGLMMAYTSGKNVIFQTHGTCTDQSVSDTLTYFTVEG